MTPENLKAMRERFDKEFRVKQRENYLKCNKSTATEYILEQNDFQTLLRMREFLEQEVTKALAEREDEIVKMIKSEEKNIGYEKGQETPNITDESLADLYETKAEAFFARFDKASEKIIAAIKSQGTSKENLSPQDPSHGGKA